MPISIHTLHTEGDTAGGDDGEPYTEISIHTLHTEGDEQSDLCRPLDRLISIHTLHTEGDVTELDEHVVGGISIHTLHTEGDSKYKQLYHICTSIDYTIYPII